MLYLILILIDKFRSLQRQTTGCLQAYRCYITFEEVASANQTDVLDVTSSSFAYAVCLIFIYYLHSRKIP